MTAAAASDFRNCGEVRRFTRWPARAVVVGWREEDRTWRAWVGPDGARQPDPRLAEVLTGVSFAAALQFGRGLAFISGLPLLIMLPGEWRPDEAA